MSCSSAPGMEKEGRSQENSQFGGSKVEICARSVSNEGRVISVPCRVPRKHAMFAAKVFVSCLLAAIIIITLVFTLRLVSHRRENEAKAENDTVGIAGADNCSSSPEAGRELDVFLAKLQDTFFKLRPYEAFSKPGFVMKDFLRFYRPYNPRPDILKTITDEGNKLYVELAGIRSKTNKTLLKPREKKAIHVVQVILKHFFGWIPYTQNYYAGDWMLGPDIFCWQPICEVFHILQNVYLANFKASNTSDLERLREKLQLHKTSFKNYIKNLELGVRAGMVRTREACKAGMLTFKLKFRQFTPLSLDNNNTDPTGMINLVCRHDPAQSKRPAGYDKRRQNDILPRKPRQAYENRVALLIPGGITSYVDELFTALPISVNESWSRQHGEPVRTSFHRYMVEYLKIPAQELLRYLEFDHMRHCVPSNISNGLSSLPLAYVYTDGVPDLNQSTNNTLPTGEAISSKEAYLKFLEFFTAANVTPEFLREEATSRMKNLLAKAVSIAKQYTGIVNESDAVAQFRNVLTSREMFYNREEFPVNESDDNAFFKCNNPESARAFCPKRTKAMKSWVNSTKKAMANIRPRLSSLFFLTGRHKVAPDCPVDVTPWFHPLAVYHAYMAASEPNCTSPPQHLLPFFVDNFGPKYTEWTTAAHEQLPGHHLEVQGHLDNFLDTCDDAISWLNSINYFPGFTEGWATYTEYPLVADAGLYSNISDRNVLLQKYGMIKYQILAALRTLGDIGVNYFGMNRTSVLELYDTYAWDNSDLASKDITRFQSTPGLVTSYMNGQMTFVKVRRLAEKVLGPSFSLPEFHYQVLRQGEIPLNYLEEFIQNYIECWENDKLYGCIGFED